jgi:tRNA(Ile)-lysidine synthase
LVGDLLQSAAFRALTAPLLPRCPFPPSGQAVTCAVSGGADSTALLALAVAAGCRVTTVHVDHGLRPGSAGEADVVAATAHHLGACFRAERVVISDRNGDATMSANQEARCREARYAVLPADVLTGHTADDQAETVLINLLRGSGLDGLAGMRGPAGHPILRLRRAETRAFCDALGLDTIDDPSNADPRHRRNRVRHELLPLLDAIAERDVAALLARQADALRDEADLLDGLAAAIDPTDARALAAAPPALARRAVRRWLADPYPPDAAAVERVLAVARGEARGCEIGAGRRVRRSAMRLSIATVAR